MGGFWDGLGVKDGEGNEMKIMDIKISVCLGVCFVVFIMVMCVIVVVVVKNLWKISDVIDEIVSDCYVKVVLVMQINDKVNMVVWVLCNVIIVFDKVIIDKYVECFLSNMCEISEYMVDLEKCFNMF